MSNMYTRLCQRRRKHQKAENLTPAERIKYGKPLRAKRGARPQSEFVILPRGDYARRANARNRGAHLH